MRIYSMSDSGILRVLGMRIKRRRLNRNIPQQELADMAGLSRTTISDLEQGKPFGMLTLIKVLRVLEALDDLDSFLPDPGISPLQMAKMKGKSRKRARKTRDRGES